MFYEDYTREALVTKGDKSGYCEDGEILYWLAINRRDKIKLNKKSIDVAKSKNVEVVVFKLTERESVSETFLRQFKRVSIARDTVLLSPSLSQKEMRYALEVLGLVKKRGLRSHLQMAFSRLNKQLKLLAGERLFVGRKVRASTSYV